MKILYIGHYKESSGWSQAAINNIMALDSVGIDIVCRNIKLTNTESKIPDKVNELESKNLDNIDYCIQHVLPHHLTRTSKFKKNVAYFVHESTSLKNINWYTNLKNMDEVWVPTLYSKKNLIKDGFYEEKLRVIPHAFEIYKYQTEYPKINFNNFNHTFKFYTIADINCRKNIESILRCFYAEFNKNDQVCLVLKLKKFGFNQKQLSEYMQEKINSIKKQLRIYKNPNSYPREIIITSEMNDDQIYSLHQSCDCFIGPSHGEGWSIPAFEAMCFGKTPICSDEGGPQEFIDRNNKSTGYLVSGNYSICNHSDPAFPNIFTGKEEWFQPSESEIKKAMRFYFENRNTDRTEGLKRGKDFSFENVAEKIKDSLNA